MFSFFSRKSSSRPPPAEESNFSESVSESQQHLTQLQESFTAGPPPTPSPAPDDLRDVEPERELHTIASLCTLIQSIPAQTLQTYTLNTLKTLSVDPPETNIDPIPILQFFHQLNPPPQLHCVRCHNTYHEVENTDRSCLIGHDDDSAEVSRVKKNGFGEYETLWACCGKTVEGDGDMGPPDGWCYEGKHTTDVKRARYRADASPYDDKLKSCAEQRCHDFSPSALHKRRREVDYDSDDSRYHDDNVRDQDEVKSISASTRGARGRRKPASTSAAGKQRRAGTPSESSTSAKPKSTGRRATKKAKLDKDEQAAPDEGMVVDEGISPQEKKPRRPRVPKSKAVIDAADIEMDEPPLPTDVGSPSASPTLLEKKPRKPRASKARPSPDEAAIPPVPQSEPSSAKKQRPAAILPPDPTPSPRAPSVPPTPGGSIKSRMKPKARKQGLSKAQGRQAASGHEDDVLTSDAESYNEQPQSRRRQSSVPDSRKERLVDSTQKSDCVDAVAYSRVNKSSHVQPVMDRKLSEVVSTSVPGEMGMKGSK